MTKFSLVMISVAVNISACKSLQLPKKQSPTEKFDIASYNKFQVNGVAKIKNEDGSETTLKAIGPDYFEQLKKDPNSPFALVLRFFKTSLKLKSSVHSFYRISTGMLLQYDEKDNLVIERNLDIPYRFSIESLIDKLLKEFNVNLLIPTPGVDVYRSIANDSKMPEYEVEILIHDLTYRHIILDGNSGVVKKDYIATNIEY